eukprot:3540521-Prymnesium_polylepis.1
MKPKRVGWSEFCCVTCDRADDPAREWREAPGWRLLPRRDSRVTGRQTSARPPASRVAGRRHGIGHAIMCADPACAYGRQGPWPSGEVANPLTQRHK